MVDLAAATFAVWVVAVPLAGIELEGQRSAGSAVQEIGLASVAATSLLAGLAGWALLAVLERLTQRARTIWTAAALVALIISLAGPLSEGRGTAATAALLSMHVVEAAVLIPMLTRVPVGAAMPRLSRRTR